MSGELGIADSRQDFDVVLCARINLEGIGKLAAEACHFDGLPLAQAANVYPRRGADERVNFARPIIKVLELNAPAGTVTEPSIVTTVPSGRLHASAIEMVLGFDDLE